MGLIKCRQCGAKVSKAAKSCPSCGAPGRKKTSFFTWLVLVLLILFIIGFFSTDESDDKSPSIHPSQQNNTSNELTEEVEPEPEAHPTNFRVSSSEDEMTGEVSHFAISYRSSPVQRMSFPYNNTQGWLGFGCKAGNEWAFVGFTNAPNLNDTSIRNGRNLIRTRIRFDDEVERAELTQQWGASFLHFSKAEQVIPKIINSNTFRIELNWHGEGSVHFEIDLLGSAAAIQEVRDKCS